MHIVHLLCLSVCLRVRVRVFAQVCFASPAGRAPCHRVSLRLGELHGNRAAMRQAAHATLLYPLLVFRVTRRGGRSVACPEGAEKGQAKTEQKRRETDMYMQTHATLQAHRNAIHIGNKNNKKTGGVKVV